MDVVLDYRPLWQFQSKQSVQSRLSGSTKHGAGRYTWLELALVYPTRVVCLVFKGVCVHGHA